MGVYTKPIDLGPLKWDPSRRSLYSELPSFEKPTMGQYRARMHNSLVDLNAAGVKFERPQGSSLHHLLDYDVDNTQGDFAKNFLTDNIQVVVVENDWGAAVPPVDGEWRVPFPWMCWEFRISGVRVLAFTEGNADHSNTGEPEMWIVFGKDGHWSVDDYFYKLGYPELPAGIAHNERQGESLRNSHRTINHELRNFARIAYNSIRSCCIMMEANVAHHDEVKASSKLSERRVRDGKAPLRDHYVVKLFGTERRAFTNRTMVASSVVDRAPQRGHWRKGTWVHFDDPASGQVQYANDGGFYVSKTWRKWHFAGDPKNIIHKEYRA